MARTVGIGRFTSTLLLAAGVVLGASLPPAALYTWWALTEPNYWPEPWYSRYATPMLLVLMMLYLGSTALLWRYRFGRVVVVSSVVSVSTIGGAIWVAAMVGGGG